MKRKGLFLFFMALMAVSLLLICTSAFAWAEDPKQTTAASPSPSASPSSDPTPNVPPAGPPSGAPPPSMGPGGPPPGAGGHPNHMGGPPLLMYGSPVMVVSGNYVYVLQNGVLYQFTVKGLKLKAKTSVVGSFHGRRHGMDMGKCPACPECKKMCPYCQKGAGKAPAKKIPKIKK